MSCFVLILCIICVILIKVNVSLDFSLKVVALITVVNVGTMAFQIFSWDYETDPEMSLIIA